MNSRSVASILLRSTALACLLVFFAGPARAGMDDIPPTVRPKLMAMFESAGCYYPPVSLTMVALKEERRLEVWSEDGMGRSRLVTVYPILAASGTSGPKLVRGDFQVPEGVYHVEYLNPYSRFHLSMKLDYPNDFDREMGYRDGRACLGDNIFIHGNRISEGCLAVGDRAIEELFMLVYDMGDAPPVKVVIAPYDLRRQPAVIRASSTAPSWLPELYEMLFREMSPFGGPDMVTYR